MKFVFVGDRAEIDDGAHVFTQYGQTVDLDVAVGERYVRNGALLLPSEEFSKAADSFAARSALYDYRLKLVNEALADKQPRQVAEEKPTK